MRPLSRLGMVAAMYQAEPETFGKYRLVRKIAEGGMASVYLASSEGPGGFAKPCAVKRIRPEFSSLPSFREMLIREARIAALLSHPNIVQVFDFGEVDGEYFLTMEWVEGFPLQRLIADAAKRGTTLELAIAVEVLIGVARALEYVHSGVYVDGHTKNLVHRDVSPSNILVSTSGAVKLTDFGVVKVLEAPAGTEVGVIKGKYAYMSPEQLKGQPLDPRSDIFSFGVVAYEMLTGRRLFRRADIAATVAAVLGSKVPRPSAVSPQVPEELDRIVGKALAKSRDQRYPSASELLIDLEALSEAKGWVRGQQKLAALVAQHLPAPPPADDTINDRLLGDAELNPLTVPSMIAATDVGMVTHDLPFDEADEPAAPTFWIAAAVVALSVFGTIWFWLAVLA